MTSSFEARILELGLELPRPPKSLANYVATYTTSSLLFISGQLCMGVDGKLVAAGSVGEEVSLEDGALAARAAAINVLAQARAALGSLDRVKQIVRLGGFIAAPTSFADHARIMNGASDLMVEVFGEQGRHTRSTIGVASLPLQAAVEVEALIEIQ
ncbi:RidA family protein [Rhizobium leguminosarum]|uniref:Endoribonuclease L-PSP protein n=1 Tax=Rhizobium leguminosarum TaxID=384 RepID=A0A2K9ZCW4_RHILE|nr:RidA family protein [Rhizobium leguminosarum]AUW46058.1 Endoribonuclease L-PSP protein [Rhizobium leguminosarum]NKL44038.1 RidA family protein [Rhizobium leguminosarum bv. viciae]TBZ79188.1 RidA family protein [Rhizobium leguminosarum bv. viciae]TBZ85626.1 RidA family protein [Rhizobium leguminosarum bv. viciae]UIJ82185.1 RidA family protein [Rhizobium leguminosarum]